MTNITINALQPTGYNLFADAESFLNELALEEIPSIQGGYRGRRYGNSHSFSGGGSSGYGGHSFSGGGSSGYGGHSFSGGGFSGHGGYYSKSYY